MIPRPVHYQTDLGAAVEASLLSIPPLWPLAANVAVNPFLGQASDPLATAAARWARTAGQRIMPSRQWYAEALAERRINDQDLADALAASRWCGKPASPNALRDALEYEPDYGSALPNVAELAAKASGVDWPAIIAERIGHWAAGYFDRGQALWRTPKGRGAYDSWRRAATHDLTPEILGLKDFAAFVADVPETAEAALSLAVERLGVPQRALESVFSRALITMGGWAQYARFLHFEADLAGQTDETLRDLLAIRMIWETALHRQYGAQVDQAWRDVLKAHAEPVEPHADHWLDTILQDAAERGAQRDLADRLSQPVSHGADLALFQAAFCIDVRSEVFRRALETVEPRVQTLGFAGFFGIGAAHRRFASDTVEHRLPVLLNPRLSSRAGRGPKEAVDTAERVKARAKRAWGRFKLAAVSSFAFVEAAGPIYLPKLFADALGLRRSMSAEPQPRLEPEPSLSDRIAAARAILDAMSFTRDFSRLVLLVGHGAEVSNNPHSSALQCGACGGFAGDVNARLLASLLNDKAVRAGLARVGLVVPDDTLFVGAIHDTTSDTVTLFETDTHFADHLELISRARASLDRAGVLARTQRVVRLPHACDPTHISRRAKDWAETRPEWGLAGCRAFIAAPRTRTRGRDLAGQAFLHDYHWREDPGFGVLELILTAPVVVASWISLQYFGSAVAPELFGGGNKLLHNVTGGLGVVEGNGGLLRGGLPWQSVHDGTRMMHDPLRLTVCIEAPREAIADVLSRHAHIRDLFDNSWMHLLVMDDHGRLAWRYAGNGTWAPTRRKRASKAASVREYEAA